MNAPINMSAIAPDYAAIKDRQRATWASGDYAVVGTTLQIVGERLCETIDVRAGERVLDVAAGNGNATLAAARRFGAVVSTDYVDTLLVRGQERARAEALSVDFQVADAEALPFADASFDIVLSTFGVMFSPDQVTAAKELSRVARSGGRIGVSNWTPDGFIGQLFKTIGKHVPPPAGLSSPALWGTEERLAELFPGHRIAATRQTFNFRYRSAEHFVDVFRRFYGPTHRAFASLDANGQRALEADILALLHTLNRAPESMVVPSAYLEAVITKP